MTVSELIRELQKFPPDTLVLKAHWDGRETTWETLDGHWFQMVEVIPYDSPLVAGRYYSPNRHSDRTKTIDALEL